jgi:hypothetical protein
MSRERFRPKIAPEAYVVEFLQPFFQSKKDVYCSLDLARYVLNGRKYILLSRVGYEFRKLRVKCGRRTLHTARGAIFGQSNVA